MNDEFVIVVSLDQTVTLRKWCGVECAVENALARMNLECWHDRIV